MTTRSSKGRTSCRARSPWVLWRGDAEAQAGQRDHGEEVVKLSVHHLGAAIRGEGLLPKGDDEGRVRHTTVGCQMRKTSVSRTAGGSADSHVGLRLGMRRHSNCMASMWAAVAIGSGITQPGAECFTCLLSLVGHWRRSVPLVPVGGEVEAPGLILNPHAFPPHTQTQGLRSTQNPRSASPRGSERRRGSCSRRATNHCRSSRRWPGRVEAPREPVDDFAGLQVEGSQRVFPPDVVPGRFRDHAPDPVAMGDWVWSSHGVIQA